MTNVYIITSEYLHNFLNINENTSDVIVKREILKAQELDLMPTLGENLYNKIISDIEGSTRAGDYLTLVNNYVAKYLAYSAYVRLLINGSYKFANGNLYRSQSENSEALDVGYLRSIKKEYEGDRDTYEKRLIDYLCYNSGNFPEYMNNNSDQVKSHKDTLFGGISITNYVKLPAEERSSKN